MGRATRWLKGLFGIRNNNKDTNTNNKDKKRCSLGEVSGRDSSSGLLCHNPGTIPPNITSSEAAWLRSYYINESEKEQSKHAIAVAAATAAAADAAVAAAQAAVAVVRLTSQGRGANMFGGGRELCAAVKIQTVFRGYLARKALRALKGLVKLQAHVRGYLVRKQATATLHSMQALIRAQATVRSQRAHNLIKQDKARLEIRARKSMETFDETRSEPTTASIHSRRISLSGASIENTTLINSDESPKIVEVDTSGYNRPKSSLSRKTNTNASVNSDVSDDQILSSPLPSRVAPRISVPQESEWGFLNDHDQYRCSTAQSTPRFMNSSGFMMNNLPVTPAKSVCADNFFRNHPNYMASTQSFKAKLRSHSAPKQRPEPNATKKRLSLNELMESRNSLSGVRMQRSCSQVQETINFKNAIMGKLDKSSTITTTAAAFARDPHRNSFSRRC